MKRFVSTLLTAVLSLSLIAACTPGETADTTTTAPAGNTSAPDPDDTDETTTEAPGTETEDSTEPSGDRITLTALVATSPDSPADLNDITILAEAEEELNIHIDWIGVSAGTAFDERKGILLATDDLPDIFYSRITDSELAMYGAQGAFIPMEDLIAEHAPNLSAILDARPELRAFNTAPDGHMYGVPKVSEGPWSAVPHVYGINVNWLEALELDMPTDLQSFEDVLVAFRDNDPNGNGVNDEVPMSFASGDDFQIAAFEYIFGALGLPVSGSMLDVEDGQVYNVATSDKFFEGMKIVSRFYEEGLVDPEALIMDHSQWVAKLNSDTSVMGVTPSWDFNDYIVDPDIRAEWDYMPALEGNDGSDPIVVAPPTYGFFRGSGVITRSNEHPEETMRYIDYWFERLNSYESIEGKIGERLHQYEDGSFEVLTSVLMRELGIEGDPMPRSASSLGFDGIWYVDAEQYTTELLLPTTDLKVEHIENNLLPFADPEPWLPVFYTPEESESIAIRQTDITNLINRRAGEWVLNGVTDADWEAFQAELIEIGIEEVTEIMQVAYDRYTSESN